MYYKDIQSAIAIVENKIVDLREELFHEEYLTEVDNKNKILSISSEIMDYENILSCLFEARALKDNNDNN